MQLKLAPDVQRQLQTIQKKLQLTHIDSKKIIAFRSIGSKARARARIWAFPKIWQMALKLPPYYCIEVVAHHFDHLSPNDKTRVLIHELMHIPQNFSGALLPHRGRRRIPINNRSVEKLFKKFIKKTK